MLTLWRPYRDLFSWGREFEDLFRAVEPDKGNYAFSPAVDIEEKEDAFVLNADLPGVNPKDLELEVHDGMLRIAGKREEANEEKREGVYRRERRAGSFERQFQLGAHVDASKIAAEYKNGVLTVTLPKSAEAKPRQIPVKTN